MLRGICLSALLLTFSGPAFAHSGHGASGFLHPFTGPDHLLAMICVGLWAALLATRRPVAMIAVPGAFVAMMAVGAAAGFAGIALPLAEPIILASVFLLGVVVMLSCAYQLLPRRWRSACSLLSTATLTRSICRPANLRTTCWVS